jgi:hypothetical protein
VSLLLPSVRIAITPSHVAVANGRAFRESAVDTPGWTGALKTLSGLVAGGALRGRASVILSHHFAHVHCLPAPPVLLKPSEMQGWIRDYLDRQYGELGRDWQIAWQLEPPGKPFLVGSIQASALEELEEAMRSLSLKPANIQPWLAGGWNRNYRRFGKGQAWYALAEPGRLMLASVAAGDIRSLRTVPMQGEPMAQLANLIQREALMTAEAASAPVYVDSALLRADWGGMGNGLTVQSLAPASASLASMLGN